MFDRVLALLAASLLAASCGPSAIPDGPAGPLGAADGPWDPSAYRACSDVEPCPVEAECAYGLCLARCNDGPACVDGEVCWNDGCRESCDASHPCTQAYSCADGACEAAPCEHLAFWPLTLASSSVPVLVHYRDPLEAAVATEVLGYLEHSWEVEVGRWGFSPPLLDGGRCGPDASFDVFLWRSYEGGDVELLAEEPGTPWDDAVTFLAFDPWGPYGGERLDATVAHELNHALQAADDWNETPIFFEMTAQFVEDQVYDADDGWMGYLADYQANPDRAFDFDDDYETFYFYGSALYLFYLRDTVFGGDPSFVAGLWRSCRNAPGVHDPDFVDALDELLRAHGTTFLDSVIGFTRWRWYAADRDDGRHFAGGASFPPEARVAIAKNLPARARTVRIEPGPMLLGAVFVELTREAGDPEALDVSITGDPRVRWSVQAVPGIDAGTDGDTLDVSSGPATLRFGGLASRTLIVLALPAGPDDPDTRTNERFPFTLTLAEPGGG
jgi:hypothetical protein